MVQPYEVKAPESSVVLYKDVRKMDIKAHHFHYIPHFYWHTDEDVIPFFREFGALIGRIPLTGGHSVTGDDFRKKVFPMCLQGRTGT